MVALTINYSLMFSTDFKRHKCYNLKVSSHASPHCNGTYKLLQYSVRDHLSWFWWVYIVGLGFFTDLVTSLAPKVEHPCKMCDYRNKLMFGLLKPCWLHVCNNVIAHTKQRNSRAPYGGIVMMSWENLSCYVSKECEHHLLLMEFLCSQ